MGCYCNLTVPLHFAPNADTLCLFFANFVLQARQQIISNLLSTENNELSTDDMSEVARLTDGYSGADMKSLCSEAAMGPVRAVPLSQIVTIDRNLVRFT